MGPMGSNMAQETMPSAALLIDWDNFDTLKGKREKIELSWFRDEGFVPLVTELKSMENRVVVFARDEETLSHNLKKEVETYYLYSSRGEVQ